MWAPHWVLTLCPLSVKSMQPYSDPSRPPPENILANANRVESIMQHWYEKAEEGITAEIDYACAIRSRRIRFANALPALIGARPPARGGRGSLRAQSEGST